MKFEGLLRLKSIRLLFSVSGPVCKVCKMCFQPNVLLAQKGKIVNKAFFRTAKDVKVVGGSTDPHHLLKYDVERIIEFGYNK